MAQALLAVIFPPRCLLCNQYAPRLNLHSVCLPCWKALPLVHTPWCTRCGLPMESAAAYAGGQTSLCGNCMRQPPPYSVARACGCYEAGLRELIHHYKFGGRRDLAYPFGQWMVHVLKELAELEDCQIVVPVPLHPRRQRQRGFNQAEWLARRLCADTRRRLEGRVLARNKNTPPQSGLTDVQRRANIRGAFRVREAQKIQGKCVLLVDDVFTTGSTLDACAQELLAAGASSVGVFTLARVARPAGSGSQ